MDSSSWHEGARLPRVTLESLSLLTWGGDGSQTAMVGKLGTHSIRKDATSLAVNARESGTWNVSRELGGSGRDDFDAYQTNLFVRTGTRVPAALESRSALVCLWS